MSCAVGRTRREACEIIEWLRVWHEIRGAFRACIDDLSLCLRRLAAVGNRQVPAAGVPGPSHTLGRERVAYGLAGLRWQRKSPRVGPFRIGQVRRAAGRGRNAAWLVRRLRGVD